MSLNHVQEDVNIYFDFNNRNEFMENHCPTYLTEPDFDTQQKIDNSEGYNDGEEDFTNLRSCEPSADTDSDSSDFDDDDDDYERPVTVHFLSLIKEDDNEDNEDYNPSENKNYGHDNSHQQTTTNSSSFPSDLPESSNDLIDLMREDLYKFVFMPMSKQFSNYVQCRVKREESALSQIFRLEIEYNEDRKSICLLTAEKEVKMIGQTQYRISVNPKFTNDFYSAELVSNNSIGTSYSLYLLNGDERQQLAVILYETNFLGFNGPRKIKVLLPKFNDEMHCLIEKNELFEDYSKERSNCFIHLHNKSPIWNSSTRSYTLRFDGKDRVIQRSVKNFQMVTTNEEDVEQSVMQFGRMSEDEFSCDFRYPLSLIQTFGIALSALESRLLR